MHTCAVHCACTHIHTMQRVAPCMRELDTLNHTHQQTHKNTHPQPSNLVAKLRTHKTDSNLLLLKMELGAGHFSVTGRCVNRL